MKYLKYTPYIYLIAAIIFAIRAIEIWDNDKDQAYLFLGITALSIFMFFFTLNLLSLVNYFTKNV